MSLFSYNRFIVGVAFFCNRFRGVILYPYYKEDLEMNIAMERKVHILITPKKPVFKPFFEVNCFIDGSNTGEFLSFRRISPKIKLLMGSIPNFV